MLYVILFSLIGLLFTVNILVVNIFADHQGQYDSKPAGNFSGTLKYNGLEKPGDLTEITFNYDAKLSGPLEYVVYNSGTSKGTIAFIQPTGNWQIDCTAYKDFTVDIGNGGFPPGYIDDSFQGSSNTYDWESHFEHPEQPHNFSNLVDGRFDPVYDTETFEPYNLVGLKGYVNHRDLFIYCYGLVLPEDSLFIGSENRSRNDALESSVYTATWEANLNPWSVKPIADAGQDQQVRPGEFVSLNGSASFDPLDRGELFYNWLQIGGPLVTLSRSITSPTAEFFAPTVNSETNLTFQLSVYNGLANSAPDTLVVKVCPPDDDDGGGGVGTASTERLSTTQLSCDDDDNEPVLDVEVNPPEINPYPPAPFPILSGITITAKNTDGTPASGVGIKVESCVKVGSATTDGHIHDNRNSLCIRGDRPYASLVWNTLRDNPITVTTDSNGIAKITYFPPKTTIGSKTYYISGVDQIIATLVTDPSIKDDKENITSKVPGLERMFDSDNPNVCLTTNTFNGSFFFERQSNHGCIFYDTPSTNDAVKRIADNFTQKQIDCRDSPNNQCTIIDDKGKQRIITIKEEPKPIKITAMNLPWGGLSDIKGNWNPPHKSHNTGKELDIGFGNLKLANGQYDMDRIHLLRYVSSLDPNFKSFVSNEGGNIAQTMATIAPHIHIYFDN